MSDPPTTSPLVAIRDKERALAQEIRSAQERASRRVAEACARATAIKEQAECDGMREVEELSQKELDRARMEADAIRRAGIAEAAIILEAGRKHIAQAVEYIIRFVLPRNL